MSNIFGQPASSKREDQYNQAYPYLQGALSGTVSNGTGAGNQIANLLGLNGQQGQDQGFQNWRNSTGYQFGLNQGISSITGNAATQGLLNSGSTLKALDTYGQNYANTQYQNYLSPLQNLLGSGLQAGSVLSSAGNVLHDVENGQGQNGGSGGILGGIVGGLLGK